MKATFIKSNVADNATLKAGILMARDLLKTINIDLVFDFVETNKVFSGEQTYAGASTVCVKGQDIVDVAKTLPPANIYCLIYDWDRVFPKPTNPAQNPLKINGGIPIQIPIQWYVTYPEVFAQFFLHELCHAESFRKGVRDLTHEQASNPEWSQKQPTDYYLHLLKSLVPIDYTTPPPASTVRTLKQGMTGEDVKQLQKDLNTLRFFFFPVFTTTFGAITAQAVRAFQTANGLRADGIVGPATREKIAEAKKKA